MKLVRTFDIHYGFFVFIMSRLMSGSSASCFETHEDSSFELSLVSCTLIETMNTSTVTRMMFIQLSVVGSSAYMITMKFHSYDLCARPVFCAAFVNTI
jgi:hypothetical protein